MSDDLSNPTLLHEESQNGSISRVDGKVGVVKGVAWREGGRAGRREGERW